MYEHSFNEQFLFVSRELHIAKFCLVDVCITTQELLNFKNHERLGNSDRMGVGSKARITFMVRVNIYLR